MAKPRYEIVIWEAGNAPRTNGVIRDYDDGSVTFENILNAKPEAEIKPPGNLMPEARNSDGINAFLGEVSRYMDEYCNSKPMADR